MRRPRCAGCNLTPLAFPNPNPKTRCSGCPRTLTLRPCPEQVRRLVGEQLARGPHLDLAAPDKVDAAAVRVAYCKHLLNSMTILSGASLSVVGMAMYAERGALMNHSNRPSCWTLFEPHASGASYTLVVRALSRISAGDEITINYVDLAKPRGELVATLEERYFIPPSVSLHADGNGAGGGLTYCGSAMPSGLEALQEVKRIGLAAGGGSLTDGAGAGATTVSLDAALANISITEAEPAHLVPACTRALDKALEVEDWRGALAAAQQLLYLYLFYYPVVHPQVGLRYMAGGLAALKMSPPQLSTSASMLKKAGRILSVTHGPEHEVSRSTGETAGLVAQLLARQGPGQGGQGSPAAPAAPAAVPSSAPARPASAPAASAASAASASPAASPASAVRSGAAHTSPGARGGGTAASAVAAKGAAAAAGAGAGAWLAAVAAAAAGAATPKAEVAAGKAKAVGAGKARAAEAQVAAVEGAASEAEARAAATQEEGNAHFRSGKWAAAVASYSEALGLLSPARLLSPAISVSTSEAPASPGAVTDVTDVIDGTDVTDKVPASGTPGEPGVVAKLRANRAAALLKLGRHAEAL